MNTNNQIDTSTQIVDNRIKLTGQFEPITYIEINQYLYSNLTLSVISIFILAFILFWELSGFIEKTTLTIWYGFVLIILALRIGLLIWFHKTKHITSLQNYHYILFVVGSSLSAIMWGIIGSLLMPNNIFYQTFILIMISGIIAGSTISLGARYLASILYIFFSLVPIIIWEALQVLNGKNMYIGILMAMVLYLFYSSITAHKNSNLVLNNINLKNQNLKLLAHLKQYLQQIELFSLMGESLEKCRSTQEIGEASKKFLPKIFPEFSGCLFLLSESGKNLKCLESWGDFSSIDRDLDFSIEECLASKTRKFYISHNTKRCKHCNESSEFYACIPLQTTIEFFGILHFKLKLNADLQNEQFILSQKDLLTRVAADISFSLSTIQYQKYLEAQATEDTLTGLYNRRYLDNYFKIELARFRNKLVPISIIMIDIDHFKRFNDQYGHKTGDQVLHELALILKRNVRGSDFACRYGGEEFILILPNSDLDSTLKRAEKIRQEVKHISVLENDISITGISVSMGISVFPEHGDNQVKVIESADEALYRAKAGGRDRICIAGQSRY